MATKRKALVGVSDSGTPVKVPAVAAVDTSALVTPIFWYYGHCLGTSAVDKYWKVLDRPLRKCDLCTEHKTEWARLHVSGLKRQDLYAFDLDNWKQIPHTEELVYRENIGYGVYRPDLFAYENQTYIDVIMVPCSLSEESVIKLVHGNATLVWTDVFPGWKYNQTFRFLMKESPNYLTPWSAMNQLSPGVYRSKGRLLYDSFCPDTYVLLKVDFKTDTETLMAFAPEDWHVPQPGTNELEYKDTRFIPDLNAYVTLDFETCYVVLWHTSPNIKPNMIPRTWKSHHKRYFAAFAFRKEVQKNKNKFQLSCPIARVSTSPCLAAPPSTTLPPSSDVLLLSAQD